MGLRDAGRLGPGHRCGVARSSAGRCFVDPARIRASLVRTALRAGRRAAAGAPAPLRLVSGAGIAVVTARQLRPDRGRPDGQRRRSSPCRLPLRLPRRPTDSRPALRRGSARDPPDPGRALDDHHQPRRPVRRLPARRPDRAPAEEGFFARDTRFVSGYELFLNGRGRSSSTPRRSSSSRRASSTPTRSCSTATASCPATAWRSAHRPDGVGRRPRGLRHRQLRPPAGPPDDRDRDRIRLRRHLRRQGRPARPPRRDQRPLVPLARASSGPPTSTATSCASWSSRRSARTARRSSPTAGSSSSPRSRRRASGTPACGGCR